MDDFIRTTDKNLSYAVSFGGAAGLTAGSLILQGALFSGSAVTLGMFAPALVAAGVCGLAGYTIANAADAVSQLVENMKDEKTFANISGEDNGLTKEEEKGNSDAIYLTQKENGDWMSLMSIRRAKAIAEKYGDVIGLRTKGYPLANAQSIINNPVFFDDAVSAMKNRLQVDNIDIYNAWLEFEQSPAYAAIRQNMGENSTVTKHWIFAFTYVSDSWGLRLWRLGAGDVLVYETSDKPYGVPHTAQRNLGLAGESPRWALARDTEFNARMGTTSTELRSNSFYRAGRGWEIISGHAQYMSEDDNLAYLWTTGAPGYNPAYNGVTIEEGADILKEGESLEDILARINATLGIIENGLTNTETGEKEDIPVVAITLPTAITDILTQGATKTGTITPELAAEIARNAAIAGIAGAVPAAPTDPNNGGSTPVIIPPASVVAVNTMYTVYNPELADLRSFSGWLWGGVIETIFNDIKKLFQSPFDAIIGLTDLYVHPKRTSNKGNIIVGNLNSGVSSYIVAEQYVSLMWEPLKVPETYYNVYDYDYTSTSIYLPFVGIQALDTPDIIGKTIYLSGTVDVLTGALLYELEVYDDFSKTKQLQYMFNGNCAVQKPLTGSAYNGVISGLLGTAAGAAASVVSGGALAPIAVSAAGGVAGSMIGGANIRQSGAIGGNVGAMGVKTPYLLITHKTPYDAERYNEFYGYPANKRVLLSSCSGYTKVKDIHLTELPATSSEVNEIEDLLKTGVII